MEPGDAHRGGGPALKAISLILSIMLIMGAALGAVVAYDRLVVEPMRQQLRNALVDLKNALVDRELLEKVLEAAKEGRATPERPIVVNVSPPGASPVPVQLSVQPPTPAQPGQPAAPPRLVADSPPVWCRTKEECDRIYQRAPQSLTVDAQVPAGTVVAVCLEALDAEGRCPEGRRANLPLAEPVQFSAQFVLAERGVFQALQVVGQPLEITRVRTETTIQVEPPTPLPQLKVERPPLPYHLAWFARAGLPGGDLTLGIRYVNRLGSGTYEVELAVRWDPARSHQVITQAWFAYVHPF